MASICFTPYKVPAVRITAVNSCGVPLTGTCASVASNGIITIEQTGEYSDREDRFYKNADGQFCTRETDPPILKWLTMTYTFCNVDPELVNIMQADPIVLSDADTPVAIGNDSNEGDTALVNFGFEGWTRLANQANCATPRFGYAVWPWNVEGQMGDVTYQNDTANFVVTARTKVGSGWGTGPYAVIQSEATTTLGNPLPLLTSIGALTHRRMFTTLMPPPLTGCGCTAIPLTLVVSDIGTHTAQVTLPAAALPAYIDWGDTNFTTVTSGPTVNHIYSGAGTYLIRLRPKNYSSQYYQKSQIIA